MDSTQVANLKLGPLAWHPNQKGCRLKENPPPLAATGRVTGLALSLVHLCGSRTSGEEEVLPSWGKGEHPASLPTLSRFCSRRKGHWNALPIHRKMVMPAYNLFRAERSSTFTEKKIALREKSSDEGNVIILGLDLSD